MLGEQSKGASKDIDSIWNYIRSSASVHTCMHAYMHGWDLGVEVEMRGEGGGGPFFGIVPLARIACVLADIYVDTPKYNSA